MRWCRDIANRLSLRSRFDNLRVVGRSPDSRIDELELPSQKFQWPFSLDLSALTVAGPCRIFTGFPIAPTVAGYKLGKDSSQEVIAGGSYALGVVEQPRIGVVERQKSSEWGFDAAKVFRFIRPLKGTMQEGRSPVRRFPTAGMCGTPHEPRMSLNWSSLVGAPRFELGTSCAQGRRSAQNNSSFSSVAAEKRQLSGSCSMWLAVRNCAHLSAGWAQKLAHSRWCPGPRSAYRNKRTIFNLSSAKRGGVRPPPPLPKVPLSPLPLPSERHGLRPS